MAPASAYHLTIQQDAEPAYLHRRRICSLTVRGTVCKEVHDSLFIKKLQETSCKSLHYNIKGMHSSQINQTVYNIEMGINRPKSVLLS